MLLTLKQAEVLTGYSSERIRDKVKEGLIPATIIKRKYMIEENDLLPFIKKNKKSEHELTHVESEVPQGNPFSLQEKEIDLAHKMVDTLREMWEDLQKQKIEKQKLSQVLVGR